MFGVFGMCLSCIFIGIFPCILSVILGCIALKDDMSYKWPSICGIVCSTVGIIMFVVMVTQTNEYKSANVATPTEVVQNITKSNEDNQNSTSNYKEQDSVVTEKSNDVAPETSENANVIDMDFNSFKVTYVSYELATDYEENPCVVIYYDFTNNSSEAMNASSVVYMKAFQNGIECDKAFVLYENEYISNHSRDIQSGITIRVGEAFSISDYNDIDVEVSEYFSWDNKKDEMTIKLN